MKINRIIPLCISAVCLIMASCTSDYENSSSSKLMINCTVQDFIDESETRTYIGVSPTDQLSYSWAVGDVLGIFPDQGTQVPFELSAGSISQDGLSATFDGGPWGLKMDHQYYSYFPFTYECFDQNVDKTKVPVSYLGQKQVGFDDTTNAGQYDFNAAGASSVRNGVVSFAFVRLGAMLRLKFSLPQTATYKTLTLTADANVIPVTGKVDLTAQNIVYTPLTYSNTMSIDLNNVQGTVGQTAYVYMMIPPMKLKTNGNTLTATLVYNDGVDKSTTYNICTANTTTINVPDILADYRYKRDAVYLSGDPVGSMSGGNDEPEDHEYVDLGLSVKWATCNIGADTPVDFGNYYAAGETKGYNEEDETNNTNYSYTSSLGQPSYVKTYYDWCTYKFSNGEKNNLTKYNFTCIGYNFAGPIDNKDTLDKEDDAAYANWGGNWHIPSLDEYSELHNNCTWTWYDEGNSEFQGVPGYKVQSKVEGYTDNYIFLPAVGYRSKEKLVSKKTGVVSGWGGYYWLSTFGANPLYLYSITISPTMHTCGNFSPRYEGCCVRPVCY